MTKEEQQFFEALSRDRTESANTLEKPSMRGIKKSVVDKYSDQAHFIYELLQNADDVGAKSVKFTLENGRLIFSHNGTIHFSVSNTNTEEDDAAKGKLGHLNSITSIANSSKNESEAKIGKFGVGFKAVFQYTNTPHIYAPNVAFKIERFIVPVLLNDDFPNRKNDETVFVFPFDNKEKNATIACEDITFKLNSLVYPILFLKNLETVNYKTDIHKGCYSKRIKQSFVENDIICEYIEFTKSLDDKTENHNLWLFSKLIDTNKISVGFFVDENGKLIEEKQAAFCFFPTKVNTNLNFIINAPFLLTDSREGIKAGVEHNKVMIQSLAKLAADSIELLKTISIEKQVVLFDDDNFIRIIPYDRSLYEIDDERTQISFEPFYEEIRNKLLDSALIPSGKLSFSNKNNAYWASYSNIPEVFENKQLSLLVDNNEAQWILPTLSRDEINRNNKTLCKYIEEIIYSSYDDEKIIRKIDEDFIESQNIDWLYKFYDFINSSNQRKQYAKSRPIFLNKERRATPAFDDKGHHVLFITDNDFSEYNSVLSELLLDSKAKELIDAYGITEPELSDEVYNKIIPKYNDLTDEGETEAFKKIFKYYKKCPQDEISNFESSLKELKFRGTLEKDISENLYIESDLLSEYFIIQQNYLDIDYYKAFVGNEDYELLCNLFIKIGVRTLPKQKIKNIGSFNNSEIKQRGLYNPDSNCWREKTYTEYSFEGVKELLLYVINQNDRKKSICLWNVLNVLCKQKYNKLYHLCKGWEFIIGRCSYFYRRDNNVAYETEINKLLIEGKWLVDKNDNFVAPASIYQQQLANDYFLENGDCSLLFDFLKIAPMPNEMQEENNNLTEEQKRKIDFANRFERLGITEEEIQKILNQRNNRVDNQNTNSHCTIIDVYNEWKKKLETNEWEDLKKDYYNRLFPTELSDEDVRKKEFKITPEYFKNYNPNTMPKSWCILFMLGNLQSQNYWGEAKSESARKSKIESMMNLIESFSKGDSLDSIYDKYLDMHETDEDDLKELESLLRVYKFRCKFTEYWSIFFGIKNAKQVNINMLINASTDAAATGKGLSTYSSVKSLKYGLSMIVRELLDSDFWGDCEQARKNAFDLLNQFTYIPHAYLRRIVFDSSEEKTSVDIHDEIKRQLQSKGLAEEEIKAFMKCHDLPFLIFGDKK